MKIGWLEVEITCIKNYQNTTCIAHSNHPIVEGTIALYKVSPEPAAKHVLAQYRPASLKFHWQIVIWFSLGFSASVRSESTVKRDFKDLYRDMIQVHTITLLASSAYRSFSVARHHQSLRHLRCLCGLPSSTSSRRSRQAPHTYKGSPSLPFFYSCHKILCYLFTGIVKIHSTRPNTDEAHDRSRFSTQHTNAFPNFSSSLNWR